MHITRRSAATRLDRLPIGRFHWRLFGLIGAGLFLDSFEAYVTGGVIGLLMRSRWADMHSGAMFISASVAGMAFGTLLAGLLGDRFGRRFTYQFNLLLFGLASFAAAIVTSMDQLIVTRFVMGIGIGAEVIVGFGTLVEFIPPVYRGRWSTGLSLCGNSSLFFSSLVGYLVLPRLGWRCMFVGIGALALVIWYMRRALPESPRWLESRGRFAEADKILNAIEAETGCAGTMLDEPAILSRTTPAHLSKRSLAPRFIVGILMSVAGNAALYGLIVWLPIFFIRQGLTVTSSLGYVMGMSAGGPAGAFVGTLIADRINRRYAIVGFSVIAAALGLVYPLFKVPALIVLTGFLLVSALYVFVAIAWAAYLPELFPTRIRLRSSSVCNAVGRLSAIGMPFAVVWLYESFGVFGVVGALAGILVIQAATVAALGINTNNVPLESLTAQPAGDSSRDKPMPNPNLGNSRIP